MSFCYTLQLLKEFERIRPKVSQIFDDRYEDMCKKLAKEHDCGDEVS